MRSEEAKERGKGKIENGFDSLKIQIPDPTPTPSASSGEISLEAIVV
jgi:hypothetical protein